MSTATPSKDDPPVDPAAQAWEERRKAWLTPNGQGRRRATEQSSQRLEKLLNPKDKAQEKAAERIITGIVQRLAQREALAEPMPLGLMVSLLYTSWLIDGTITQEMLKEGRVASDNEGKPH